MSDPAISVRIQHRFGPGFALDVDLSTATKRLALFGPSGAGKSSILLAVAGLFTPDAGRVALGTRVLLDTDARQNIEPQRRKIGYVPQQSWLFPLLTVRQNLCFGRPASPRLELEEVAEALGVSALLDRRPRLLSGGERQRVALGRAILSEPSALLCDEPFSALDLRRRDALLERVEQWRERLDIPLILVTHQAEEVDAMADDVAVIRDGKVAAAGPASDLREHLLR